MEDTKALYMKLPRKIKDKFKANAIKKNTTMTAMLIDWVNGLK